MALIQSSLIWVTYGITAAILVIVACIFVYTYQKPRERALSVTVISIFTVTAILATVLLLPVDVALVSSTVNSKTGARKDWATDKRVDNLVLGLKIVYYTLYSLDALLCLLVVPFTYFYYEEYDEREAEEGNQSFVTRAVSAAKYTAIFLVLCIILFLVGFFVPIKHKPKDLDHFKDLLSQNRKYALPRSRFFHISYALAEAERALTFALGLLITLGTFIYVLYTSAGLALLPITWIKSAPSISAPKLAATTASQLEQNRERQRQLEGRNEGRQEGLEPRDRRELEALVREERTLIRRERLAAEGMGEDGNAFLRIWTKVQAVFRPIKLLLALVLMLVAVVIWVSMLISGIDKAKNSICGAHCGYLLERINVFQPLNYIFVQAARVFPIDYVLMILLVTFLFSASIVGIATVGIRFLWIVLFKIRKAKTSPQALLMATVMLLLMTFAINYAIVTLIAPQYAVFGSQRYCDLPTNSPKDHPSCAEHKSKIKFCNEPADNEGADSVCTPSVASEFIINRMTVDFPFFGIVTFWAQFVFLGKPNLAGKQKFVD